MDRHKIILGAIQQMAGSHVETVDLFTCHLKKLLLYSYVCQYQSSMGLCFNFYLTAVKMIFNNSYPL